MRKGIRWSLLTFVLHRVSAEDEVTQLVNEPCVNWETTAAAYQEAFAQRQEPACYTFGYTFLGFSVGEPELIRRNVRNGVSMQEGDGQPFQTLDDVWNLIDEQCIQNCPSSGAHYCDIEYATTQMEEPGSRFVYPAYVGIDPDSMLMDEELSYRIEDVRALDCADLDALDGENDTQVEAEAAIKADLCVNYDTVKTKLETALLQWEISGNCYNYTIERVGLVTEEYRGSFEIVVQDGVVVAMMSAFEQPEMNRTLSDWLTEIQTMCVDRCLMNNSETPYYDCQVEYDATLGYPTYMMLDPDQYMVDEELYYNIGNLSFCEEQIIGDEGEPAVGEDANSAVCIDYDAVKSDFDAAIQKWNLVDGCYDYVIERQGRISDEFRGPFEVQVRDGVPKVVNMPTESNGADGPNMTFTLSDWMAEIDKRCVAGCEVAGSSEAYYYCSLEYDPTWGYPTSIFFDPDENIADEELYYTLSNFTPCESGAAPEDGNNQTSNCTGLSDDAYEFDAAYAKLETLLAENPCYDFTYTPTGFLYPPPESVTVSFRDESHTSQSAEGEFSSLFDVMDFYKQTCFPCNNTVRPFSCSITYDDLGIPSVIWIDYMEMLADEEAGYTVSNVTFAPCSTEPSQHDCDSGWSQAKAKWSPPACYEYSVRRVGEIPAEREGPFTIQVQDDKVTNGSAVSVNMTLDDMFALIEEKCVTGCPDTEAFRCDNTYDSEFGFPTRIYIDYDELMADEEEIYVISDFKSCDMENGDDGAAANVCQDWEKLSDAIDAMEANWKDPPCYQYTAKSNDGAAITVHVRNSTVVSPNNTSEIPGGSFEPETFDEFIAEIRAACIDGCPKMGSATCSYESTGEGPVGSWLIETKSSTKNFTIFGYEVVSCDKVIVTSAEDTSASSDGATIATHIGFFAAVAFLLQ